MEQHPFEDAAEGRGRVLSRRDLLAVTGGAVLAGSLAGNTASALAASAAAKPKRGGTFRLGVTGGGAKDFIDGQSITTKPDQARLTSGWETLLSYDRNYKLGTDGARRGGDAGQRQAVDDPAQERHRVPQRQDAHAPTTSSTRCAASRIRRTSFSGAQAWPPSTSRSSRRWTS